MANIIAYMAHDAVSNTEGVVQDFDSTHLQELEDNGIIFIAVYDDETRATVKAADVTEPEPMVNGVELATPAYVDERTDSAIAVFDAIADVLDPPDTPASGTTPDWEAIFREKLTEYKKYGTSTTETDSGSN